MLNSISKLIVAVLLGWFLIWATYKIGSGLDYWGPFVAVVIGLVGGLIYGVAKMAVKNRSKK
jgi:uncharacterized membrane protein